MIFRNRLLVIALAILPSFAHAFDSRPILEQLRATFAPLARQAGGVLTIEVDPQGTLVVAAAKRDSFQKFQVVVYQAMLDSPRLTPDSLRITVCHELGHLFGGEPLRAVPPEWDGPVSPTGSSLLSAEGEADFYATQVCFRQSVRGENHAAVLSGRAIPAPVALACDSAWRGDLDSSLICRRAALASFEFLNMVKDFPISLERHDPGVVVKTLKNEYPPRQCRLDTLVNGALCADQSNTSCRATSAARPRCWFAEGT